MVYCCTITNNETLIIGTQVAFVLVGQASPRLGNVQESWARLWLVCWWLIVDVLCSVYTGNLVAILTFTVYPPLMHTVKEIADSHLV